MSKYTKPQPVDVLEELAKFGDDLPDDLANSIPMPKIPPPPPLPPAEPPSWAGNGGDWSDPRWRMEPAQPGGSDIPPPYSTRFRKGYRR
jgi:hypothetical protein